MATEQPKQPAQALPVVGVPALLANIARELAIATAEYPKLEKGQKAAAAKFRNAALQIVKDATATRKPVLDMGKAIQRKSRAKPAPVPEPAPVAAAEELPPGPPKLERQAAQQPPEPEPVAIAKPAPVTTPAPKPTKKVLARKAKALSPPA